MLSTQVLVSTTLAGLVLLINGVVMFLVLSRGRQQHHYLFATLLATFAITGLSMFLIWIRNSHPDELIVYYSIPQIAAFLSVPCIYHFTCSYLNQPRKKSTIFIWAYTTIGVIFILFDMVTGIRQIMVIHADWGNYVSIFGDTMASIITSITLGILLVVIWAACWLLFCAHRREPLPLVRRHITYILISFLAISLLFLTLFPFTKQIQSIWPIYAIRGLVYTAFGALIGVAIVKEHLLDITVIIKKTTIYSILLALIIFIFSLSEHMLATYVGEFFGEHSIFIHIISIAVVIAVLMPIRQKIERAIERFFAKKTIEF